MAVLLVLTMSACGRLGYDNSPLEGVTIESEAGTVLPAGGTLGLTVSVDSESFRELGAFVAGQEVTLRATNGARLRTPSDEGERVTLRASEDGTFPSSVDLVVGLDMAEGTEIEIQADLPLDGDTVFRVRVAGLVDQTPGPYTYRVHEGFVADEPVALDGMDRGALQRAEALAFWSSGSSFGDTVQIGLSAPPTILRAAPGGALETLAVDDSPENADAVVTQLSFPDIACNYGDVMYLCLEGSGGIRRIDAGGEFQDGPMVGFPCEGLTFDQQSWLDDPDAYYGSLYFSDRDGKISRTDPWGETVMLGDGLPVVSDRLRLRVFPQAEGPARLLVLSPGDAGMGNDGVLYTIDSMAPFSGLTPFLTDLPEPRDAAYSVSSPYRGLMMVALAGSDEVVAIAADGTVLPVISGIAEPVAIAFQGDALWVVGRGRGELVRLRPTAP